MKTDNLQTNDHNASSQAWTKQIFHTDSVPVFSMLHCSVSPNVLIFWYFGIDKHTWIGSGKRQHRTTVVWSDKQGHRHTLTTMNGANTKHTQIERNERSKIVFASKGRNNFTCNDSLTGFFSLKPSCCMPKQLYKHDIFRAQCLFCFAAILCVFVYK